MNGLSVAMSNPNIAIGPRSISRLPATFVYFSLNASSQRSTAQGKAPRPPATSSQTQIGLRRPVRASASPIQASLQVLNPCLLFRHSKVLRKRGDSSITALFSPIKAARRRNSLSVPSRNLKRGVGGRVMGIIRILVTILM